MMTDDVETIFVIAEEVNDEIFVAAAIVTHVIIEAAKAEIDEIEMAIETENVIAVVVSQRTQSFTPDKLS